MDNKNRKEGNVNLSVIIPCYNTPKDFLEAAVNSAQQADSDIEIVLVDDGSNSDCHDVLEAMANESSNVELVTIKNQGVSNARNVGVQRARGKYVTFLDADDLLTSGFYKGFSEIMRNLEPELLIAGSRDFSNNDELTSAGSRSGATGKKCDEEECQHLIEYYLDYNIDDYTLENKSTIGRGEISARVVRRDVLLEHPFDTSIRYGEDLIWNIGLLQTCSDIYIVDSHWYWYRYNENSVSRSYNSRIYEDMIKMLERIESMIDLNNDELYRAFVNKIYNCIYISWKYYIRNKETNKEDRKIIKRAIMREEPWVKFKEKRYRSICNGKMRLFSFLYKLNLLFAALKARDIIGI